MTQKTTVLFLIDSLAAGGAERQLCELVKHMDRTRFDVHVAVFYGPGYFNGGELWPDIANLPDVTLHDLKKRRGVPGYFTALPKLLALILRIRADVLHGYIDGNLPLLLLGRLLRRPIVWGIRSTATRTSPSCPAARVSCRPFCCVSPALSIWSFSTPNPDA